jgi:hypothetical protein
MSEPSTNPIVEYKAVFIANSAVRFREAIGIEIPTPLDPSGVTGVRIYTNYEDCGFEAAVPRELVFEVTTNSATIDDAMLACGRVAAHFAVVLAFTANARIMTPTPWLIFETTMGVSRRNIRENSITFQKGFPQIGRFVEPDDVSKMIDALNTTSAQPRIGRAMSQYDAALKYWTPSALVMAMEHLYIAAECLAAEYKRKALKELATDDVGLAKALGLNWNQSSCMTCGATPEWKRQLTSAVIKKYIFEENSELFDAARKASNGFEHGYLNIAEIITAANSTTRDMFKAIRRAIFGVLPLDQDVKDRLSETSPVDPEGVYHSAAGIIVGQVDSPLKLVPDGQRYPNLGLRLEIDSARMDGKELKLVPHLTMTANVGDGLSLIPGHGINVGLNDPSRLIDSSDYRANFQNEP